MRRLARQPVQPVVVEAPGCAPPADRAASAGTSGWWCRLRPPRWSRATPAAAGPPPRRGRGPTPRSWRSSSRSRPGSGRPPGRRRRRGSRCPRAAGAGPAGPGAGANPFSGSSAFSRASIACPETGGCAPVSRPPCATCSCSLTRSQPGGRLGHRVLDLQPGVDLHELEAAGVRVDQELDRAGVAVAGGGAQPHGRVADRLLLGGVEHRRRRLLEHLLVPALQTCSHGRRPPTRCRNRRRSPAPRRDARPGPASPGRRWGRRRPAAPRRAPTAARRPARRRRGPSGSHARRRPMPPSPPGGSRAARRCWSPGSRRRRVRRSTAPPARPPVRRPAWRPPCHRAGGLWRCPDRRR